MKLTKYEHACFTVEKDGQTLIIDPGVYASSLVIPDNVVGIVVTHEHPDHFDPDMLAAIYDKNPESILVSLPSITALMPDHKLQSVSAGDSIDIGAFHLEFFGGKHAEVHSSMPIADNVGVLINNAIYYPGDSFAEPGKPVELLALPTGGPWLKYSVAADFAVSVHPKKAFGTHNIHLSDEGRGLVRQLSTNILGNNGIEYLTLNTSDSVEV